MHPSASGEASATVLNTLSSASPAPATRLTVGARRVPRRTLELASVALVFVVLLCVFYREVIFEGRTFLPFGYPSEVMGPAPPWGFSGVLRQNPYRLDAGGSAWQLEPWARVLGMTYRNLGLPLWNPHQFFGIPFAADAQPGPFDVFRLPAVLTTHAWGWDIYYLLQAALGLALTYGFARTAGFRIEAALVAAIGYTFCGFMFIRGNMHYAEIYHVLPLLLWGTELLVQGRSRTGVVLVAVGLPLAIFAGFPEVTALALLYAGSFGVFRIVWTAVAQKSFTVALRLFGMLALAWIVGIGLAAPQLVPLLEYMPISFNIHPPERGLGLITLPLRSLGYIGVPYIEGVPTKSLIPNDLFSVDDYSGAAVIVLAVLGVLSLKRLGLRKPRSVAVFALCSALIWGAKLYGVPGIRELGGAPLLVQTLIYIFGSPLLSLSLALLAAAGVHAIGSRMVGSRSLAGAAAAFIGYLGLVAVLHAGALSTQTVGHAVRTLGVAAIFGFGALACVWLARRWSTCAACSAACLVVAIELAVLAPRDVYSDRYDSLTQPPFVSWLQQQQSAGQPFRVFSNDGILYPDYAGAFGLDDLRDVDALYPRRVWDFVKTFLSPTVSDRYVGGFGHPEQPTDIFANKWLNFSNVRYILRPAGQSPSDATLAASIVVTNQLPNDDQHLALFTIDGQRREVLVQRTPGEVEYPMHPDASHPTLSFDIGLDPTADSTTAAEFIASIEDEEDGQRQVVFDQSMDASQASGQHWAPGSIDLSPYLDRDIKLVLQTRALDGHPPTSAPGWGDMHLLPLPDAAQFKQVYSGEVSIWENTQAAPRAFLISNAQRAASQADAMRIMQTSGFDPMSTAVVEGDVSLASDAPASGNATITDYSPRQVQIRVTAQQPSLLLLTDTYYPGWTATVDGVQTPILATDLAFRGVMIPPGAHQVTYHFEPVSLEIGLGFAVVALLALALALIGMSRRRAT